MLFTGMTGKKVEAGDLQKNIEARYLRLVNKGEKPVTAMVKKLAAVIENRAVSMSVKGTNIKELQSGSWDRCLTAMQKLL